MSFYDDYDFSELNMDYVCSYATCNAEFEEGLKAGDIHGPVYCSIECMDNDHDYGDYIKQGPYRGGGIYFTVWDHSLENDYETLYREFRWKK